MDAAPTEIVTETPAPPQKEPFSVRIRILQERSGVPRKKLADMIGCSYRAVDSWFEGTREPELRFVRRMAEIFGVTTKYLNQGGPQPRSVNKIKESTVRTNKAFREDEAIANAVERAAESKFLRGLRIIGLTDEQIEFATSSQEFKHENMLDTVTAIGGMIDRLLIDLMLEVRSINAKLADPTVSEDLKDKYFRRRSSLHYDIGQFSRINQNGLILSARVQQIWHEINGKGKCVKKVRTLDLNEPE